MEKAYIQHLWGILIDIGYITEAGTKGCSEQEVIFLDKYAATGKLPELYRQFLFKMGSNINGTYLGDYYYQYEYLSEIQKEARRMAEQGNIQIPPSAFFFATFDYVDYYYFLTDEQQSNPPVYFCGERRQPIMIFKSLKDFFGYEYGEEGCDELL